MQSILRQIGNVKILKNADSSKNKNDRFLISNQCLSLMSFNSSKL